MSSKVIDLGDLCVWCRQDTSFGSGKFVNRYPAYVTDPDNDDIELEGYCCDDCEQEWINENPEIEELDNEN